MHGAELAERFGTPLFVDDLDTVDETADRLVQALKPVPRWSVLYSIKANPSPPILRRLAERGFSFDACSAFDLAILGRLDLLRPECSFCTHSLDEVDLRAVIDADVHVVADSVAQVERYRSVRPRQALGLRVNVGVASGFHSHVRAAAAGERFGVPMEDVGSVMASSGSPAIVGFHCHIGSDVHDVNDHLLALDRLLHLAEEWTSIDYVNLGGGLATLFVDDESYDLEALGVGIADRMEGFRAKTGRLLELRIEPGGFLSRESGLLLVTVNEVRVVDERQVVLTDGSINVVPGALLYDAVHPVVAVGRDEDVSLPSTVVGNLMQPGDVLRRSCLLPSLRPGDVLAFGLTGAYCLVRGSTFNGRPLPAEVAVAPGSGKIESVRRRRTPLELVSDLYEDECLSLDPPTGCGDWLAGG